MIINNGKLYVDCRCLFMSIVKDNFCIVNSCKSAYNYINFPLAKEMIRASIKGYVELGGRM